MRRSHLGLDTLVAGAFGAGDLRSCHVALVQGVYTSVFVAVPLTVVLLALTPQLDVLGADPAILEHAAPYLSVVAWSALPLLLFTTLRRYLQAMNRVRPVMLALVSANLVNIAGNWLLVFGNLGAPASVRRGLPGPRSRRPSI